MDSIESDIAVVEFWYGGGDRRVFAYIGPDREGGESLGGQMIGITGVAVRYLKKSEKSIDRIAQLEADLRELARMHSKEYGNLKIANANARVARAMRDKAQLEVGLKEIAEHDYCDYSSSEVGEYGRGVTDGHRCAAKIARKALEAGGE